MELIANEASAWNSKDVIEFLEGSLFCLRDKEEDHDEGHNVETGVEAESTCWGESCQDTWEGDGEDSGPEKAGGDGPTHSDFSVGEWEDFGRVGEWDGTFTR